MDNSKKKSKDLEQLIAQLDKDRAWLLEMLDQGNWNELRIELASLERELGNLLTKIGDDISSF